MDLVSAFILAGCCCLIVSVHAKGLLIQNGTKPVEDESPLPAKERFRRLIPYIAYYLDPALQQYQDLQQYQNFHQYQDPQVYQYQQQLLPVGYLVGGGYSQVPVYSTPDYTQLSYKPQSTTDLTQVIAQNYLAIAKQMETIHQQHAQSPNQPMRNVQYKKQQNPSYVREQHKQLSSIKNYFNRYLQPNRQIKHRQPYTLKSSRPQYTVPKEESYVQIQSNFEPTHEATQRTKTYKADPNTVLTITKSQEIRYFPQDPISPPSLGLEFESSVPVLKTNDNNGLTDLFDEHQLPKVLPQKDTPQIGLSPESLSSILKRLKKIKTHPNYVVPTSEDDTLDNVKDYSPFQTEGSTPGRAGIDYPVYGEIPETRFDCKNQRYKGFFGDPDTNCQVWHYCDLNGGKASFLCPNGTIFSQVALTCDWWFNVKCSSTAQLYVLNERLYKYILPHKPSFPEDYAGPLVDQYLTEKFHELEAKKEKNSTLEKPSSTLQVLLNDEINQAVK